MLRASPATLSKAARDAAALVPALFALFLLRCLLLRLKQGLDFFRYATSARRYSILLEQLLARALIVGDGLLSACRDRMLVIFLGRPSWAWCQSVNTAIMILAFPASLMQSGLRMSNTAATCWDRFFFHILQERTS